MSFCKCSTAFRFTAQWSSDKWWASSSNRSVPDFPLAYFSLGNPRLPPFLKFLMFIHFRWGLSDCDCLTLNLSLHVFLLCSSSGGSEHQRSGVGASCASIQGLPEECQETSRHPRPAGAPAPSGISHKHIFLNSYGKDIVFPSVTTKHWHTYLD